MENSSPVLNAAHGDRKRAGRRRGGKGKQQGIAHGTEVIDGIHAGNELKNQGHGDEHVHA